MGRGVSSGGGGFILCFISYHPSPTRFFLCSCKRGLATKVLNLQEMGRGVSSGGGQSSLGYLFGSGETANNVQGAANSQGQPENGGRTQNASVASPPIDKQVPVNGGRTQNATTSPIDKQIPAGIPGCLKNNYHRADGQNCGNFLTDRPSTKVHAAPGGGSSLGYLFGGPSSN